MKLALVSLNASTDVSQWSGLNYHIGRSLERAGATLYRIGPLAGKWSNVMRLRSRWYRATGTSYHAIVDPVSMNALGSHAREMIPHDTDVVLAVTSLVAAAIGPLDIPLASWDDATHAAMMGYYPDFQRIAPVSRRQITDVGAQGARAVSLAIYASDWAATSARTDYSLPPERVAVVPFGPNLEQLPTAADVDAAIAARPTNCCRLLWIGVEWHRKGGALTLATAQKLRDAGLDVQLTIIGCDPSRRDVLPSWVHVQGFISKGESGGEKRLAEHLARAHFFMMPSSAEAYGLVYVEAAAFGVPSIAIRTGGVPTIVVDNETGVLENPGTTAHQYAARILSLVRDRARYERMARAARHRMDERLNWDVAGRTVMKLLGNLR